MTTLRSYQIATAPCSWGVDFADRPENPNWRRVLDEAAAAGFSTIDLGPVGYFPPEASQLADELARRGLQISAGGLFDPLANRSALPSIIDKTRRTCRLLQTLDAPRLVIIDSVSLARGATAGRSKASSRLDVQDWATMMGAIKEISRIARDEYGVSSYLHAHAGTSIEYEDELMRAMDDLPEDLVGLCVDTGHATYAGMEPDMLIRRFGNRVRHIHFKDIDREVHAACVRDSAGFYDAVARKIFCPLGKGAVDFIAVRDALASIGYTGIIVIEQDVDPTGDVSPLNNARANRGFLESIGFLPENQSAV